MNQAQEVPAGTPATRAPDAARVGLFGLLGSGNIGNDGSLEALLDFLRQRHPEALLDFMCAGPEEVTRRYGLPAVHLHWHHGMPASGSGLPTRALTLLRVGLGIIVDAGRTASWVRRHDVVIVPGMGVLEATLPLRPWQTPYSMFLLSAAGRLFRTKVALVSVGANVMNQRVTRWLLVTAARLACYRSYRDEPSRDAMRRMGVDVSDDAVYPDLAFALPTPENVPRAEGTVGVGVMDFHGGNDDRELADEIHAGYVEKVECLVRRLVDAGRSVRLLTGDPADERVVADVLADVRFAHPELPAGRVTAEPIASLDDLMRQIAPVDAVVATRFHNVLCALKLAKPTVSVGYATKSDVLMAQMGMAEFCQGVRDLDVDRLLDQLAAVEGRRNEIQRLLTARNQSNIAQLQHQFDRLSAELLEASDRTRPTWLPGRV